MITLLKAKALKSALRVQSESLLKTLPKNLARKSSSQHLALFSRKLLVTTLNHHYQSLMTCLPLAVLKSLLDYQGRKEKIKISPILISVTIIKTAQRKSKSSL